jgi:hypothetical protein
MGKEVKKRQGRMIMNGFGRGTNLVVQTFSRGSMIRSLAVLLVVYGLVTGSSLEKPSPRSSNTWQHLHLVNKSYSVLDLMEEIDQEDLSVDSLGNPEIYIRQQIGTVRATDNLASPGHTEGLIQQLGTVRIESPAPQSVSLGLSEFNPTWPGQTLLPFHFEVTKPLAEFQDSSHATVEAGRIYLFVNNHLGVDLDSLTLKLIGDHNCQILRTIVVAGGLSDTIVTAIPSPWRTPVPCFPTTQNV